MAGDWIKMRVDLADDPAIVSISSSAGISEDEVVGKLHRLWSWADRHTRDGRAPAITRAWVDKYVGRAGFADAMVDVGWLNFPDGFIEFPNFDRHNGSTAKVRSENTIRQRLSRAQRDSGITGDERGAIPRPFRKHVLQRDGYRCVFCGTESDLEREGSRKARLSVDHLVPCSRGGMTIVSNLVSCCKLCNNEKNDRTPEEWGLTPNFLADGLEYIDGEIVESATKARQKRDKSATREEKRREEYTRSVDPDHVDPKATEKEKREPVKLSKAEPFARKIFAAIKYRGNNGGNIWGIAALMAAGKIPEHWMTDSASGTKNRKSAPDDPPAYFYSIVDGHAKAAGQDLAQLLRTVRLIPEWPTGPPPDTPPVTSGPTLKSPNIPPRDEY